MSTWGPECCGLQLQHFDLAETLTVRALLKASLGSFDIDFDNSANKSGKGKAGDFCRYARVTNSSSKNVAAIGSEMCGVWLSYAKYY